jgi:hypothetical protein
MNPAPGVEIFNFDSINQLAEQLPRRRRYFTLLLAWDALEIDKARLIELFRPLVDRGLTYFCAWGSDCEKVHDAVDLADIGRMGISGSENYIVMTTWHHDEPLEEALWFFNTLAIPAEDFISSDLERFAVAIGNPEWAVRMELGLSTQTSESSPNSSGTGN